MRQPCGHSPLTPVGDTKHSSTTSKSYGRRSGVAKAAAMRYRRRSHPPWRPRSRSSIFATHVRLPTSSTPWALWLPRRRPWQRRTLSCRWSSEPPGGRQPAIGSWAPHDAPSRPVDGHCHGDHCHDLAIDTASASAGEEDDPGLNDEAGVSARGDVLDVAATTKSPTTGPGSPEGVAAKGVSAAATTRTEYAVRSHLRRQRCRTSYPIVLGGHDDVR